MIVSISALTATGIVPILNVLAPRVTVGMEDCGVMVVICAPGPVVELTLLPAAAVLLLPTLLPLILLPLIPVTETITLWACADPSFFTCILATLDTPGFKLVVVVVVSKTTLPGSINGTVKLCERYCPGSSSGTLK
jgi:hypothetical protein